MQKQTKDIVQDLSLMTLTMELTALLVLPILGFLLLGYVIDRATGSGFFFLIGGAILGMLIATILAVRKVTAVLRSVDNRYRHGQQITKDDNTIL